MDTTAVADSTTPANRRLTWKWIVGGIGALVLVLLLAVGFMRYRMNYVPADLDLATTRLSEQQMYRVSYAPNRSPIAINQIHTSIVNLRMARIVWYHQPHDTNKMLSYVQGLPLPCRDYLSRGVALVSIFPQLSRRGRVAASAWPCPHV